MAGRVCSHGAWCWALLYSLSAIAVRRPDSSTPPFRGAASFPVFSASLMVCRPVPELHAIGQLDTSVPQASECPGSIRFQELLVGSIRLFLILLRKDIW